VIGQASRWRNIRKCASVSQPVDVDGLGGGDQVGQIDNRSVPGLLELLVRKLLAEPSCFVTLALSKQGINAFSDGEL